MITGAMHAPAVTPSAANKTTLRYPAASRIQIATKTAAYVQAQPVAIGRPLRVSKPGQLGRCAEKSRMARAVAKQESSMAKRKSPAGETFGAKRSIR